MTVCNKNLRKNKTRVYQKYFLGDSIASKSLNYSKKNVIERFRILFTLNGKLQK